MGERVVDHPAAADLARLALPDFRGLRLRLRALTSAYDGANRQRYLGEPVTQEASRADLAALEQGIAQVREEGRTLAVKQATRDGLSLGGGRRDIAGHAAPPPIGKRHKYGSLGDGGSDD